MNDALWMYNDALSLQINNENHY